MPKLDFKGKPFVYSHHLSVPFRELIVDPAKSLPPLGAEAGLDGNLIIHGDNLEALKALLPRYAGKVDVIYIDPPYNTGNEGWAYNDNVNAPQLKAWLGKVVDADDMERHDKWLCMMWPRLQLLKELLADHGAVFISISDEEFASLRQLCDEIFGQASLVADIIWNSTKSVTNTALISNSHTHTLCFAKNKQWLKDNRREFRLPESGEGFANPDDDSRGPWKADPFQVGGWRPNQQYQIINPITGEIYTPNEDCSWKNDKERFDELFSDNRIVFGVSGEAGPQRKRFLTEAFERGRVSTTLWSDLPTTTNASTLQKRIFGKKVFDNPKPHELVERVIELARQRTGSTLILDSFAGSGTTAHAVLALNKADGGNRKFILVETEDYADSLTAERVRRVIKGVPGAKDEALKDGLGGGFTYCELGEPMDLERFFADGGKAPSWDQVARYVVYTATGETLAPAEGEDGFAGYAGPYRLHLLYRADAKWMRSNAAMLDLTTAERIAAAAKANGDKPVLVFAAGKLMGQRVLTDLGLTFCQLPYSVHRILGDGTEGVAGVDAA